MTQLIEYKPQNWKTTVKKDTGGLSHLGVMGVGGFILIFGLWAALFPIAAAVVASGSIIPAGQSKVIQHPTGGTVISIAVRDGMPIKQGETILTLDPVVDRAEFDRIAGRLVLYKAMEARLSTQLSGGTSIRFPDSFYKDISGQETAHAYKSRVYKSSLHGQIVRDQRDEFKARRNRLDQDVLRYKQQIFALEKQARGLASRQRNTTARLGNLEAQIKRVKPISKVGYFPRNRLDELERQLMQITAEKADVSAELSALQYRTEEIRNIISSVYATRRAEAGKELSEVRGEIESLTNQIKGARNILEKRDVRAPVDGVLTKSSIHTIGGVVKPGEIVAEIIPAEGYIVEARVAPHDIDNVQVGQSATVAVTAFNQRLQDPFEAEVSYVAANSHVDEKTGESHFVVRLVITDLPSLEKNLNKLRAGMQSDVYITTGERPFLAYVMRPMIESFSRAFRER